MTPEQRADLDEMAASIESSLRRGPVTMARLMRKHEIGFRAAYKILSFFERAGILVRSGGGPGEAFVWKRARHGQEESRDRHPRGQRPRSKILR